MTPPTTTPTTTNFVLYVSRDLRIAWVHEDCSFIGQDAIGIAFIGDLGKETRCHRVTPKIIEEIRGEMLRFEDEYFEGRVSATRYERGVQRWRALLEAVEQRTMRGEPTEQKNGEVRD